MPLCTFSISVGTRIREETCPPSVSYDIRILGNKHALVHLILSREMRRATRSSRAPSNDFTDECLTVRKRVDVFVVWKTVLTDNGVQLSLSFLDGSWVSGAG